MDKIHDHLKRKEDACDAVREGKPLPQQVLKKYWWETEEKEGN